MAEAREWAEANARCPFPSPLTEQHYRAWIQDLGGNFGQFQCRQAVDILRSRAWGWVSGRYLRRIEQRYQQKGIERQFLLRNPPVVLTIYMRRSRTMFRSATYIEHVGHWRFANCRLIILCRCGSLASFAIVHHGVPFREHSSFETPVRSTDGRVILIQFIGV